MIPVLGIARSRPLMLYCHADGFDPLFHTLTDP